jgi:flavin prenyltransferase
LSLIHLRALTTLAEAGATIMPASPGFYHGPEKIQDLIDFVVDRILQHLGVEFDRPARYPVPRTAAQRAAARRKRR